MAQCLKKPPANAGNFILGLGRSPEGGSGKPLRYSCLENPVDRGGRLQSIESQTDKTRTQIRKKAGEDFLCYKISDQPHYLLSLS